MWQDGVRLTLSSPDYIATWGGVGMCEGNVVHPEAISCELASRPPGRCRILPAGCCGMPPWLMHTGAQFSAPMTCLLCNISASSLFMDVKWLKFASWPAVCGRQLGRAAGPFWVGSHPLKHLSWCCGEIIGTEPPRHPALLPPYYPAPPAPNPTPHPPRVFCATACRPLMRRQYSYWKSIVPPVMGLFELQWLNTASAAPAKNEKNAEVKWHTVFSSGNNSLLEWWKYNTFTITNIVIIPQEHSL